MSIVFANSVDIVQCAVLKNIKKLFGRHRALIFPASDPIEGKR
jgi:hypothetical protein